MSQCSTTILGSCGLIVGAIIVPPPPGPMMVQGSEARSGRRFVSRQGDRRQQACEKDLRQKTLPAQFSTTSSVLSQKLR